MPHAPSPIAVLPCGTAVLHPANLSPLARRIADRAAVSDIEIGTSYATDAGKPWRDIRPMPDEREHSPECIAMACEALQYATARRLVITHPTQAHLVRVDLDALARAHDAHPILHEEA